MIEAFEPVTLGRSLAELDLGWLSLRETLHRPGFSIAPHSHENVTINFLLEGAFEEAVGGSSWDVRRSLVLGKPAGEPHANRYGPDGARCLLIELKGRPPFRIPEVLDRPVVFESELAERAGLGLARELGALDAATPLVVEGIFVELFASLAATRLSAPRPEWLRRAVEVIEDCLFEPLRIAEIARAAGVHPVHLAREFRRHLHVSPGELVRLRRLAWARDRLRASALPLAAIAAAAGFADQSHFSRLFRARYGISPALYRRRSGGSAPARGRLQPF